MVLGLEFYTKDPYSVVEAVKKILFPDLQLYVGCELDPLVRRWDAVLVGWELTSFVEKSFLIANQDISPITIWEAVAKRMEDW